MRKLNLITVLILTLISVKQVRAALPIEDKPTIIFVHGIWADGSCWTKTISTLQKRGYQVLSVQNTVNSLQEDVAITKRAISQAKGKVILVGHSWGGMVITQAGNDPKVVGLVYLAAYGPEAGESLAAVSLNAPQTELTKYLMPVDNYVFITREGVERVFAPDINAEQQGLVYATQVPAANTVFENKGGEPAWKSKKSWYVVAQNDLTIHPDLERFMAKRMKAQTTEIPSSHVMMLSHPDKVLQVILEAADYRY